MDEFAQSRPTDDLFEDDFTPVINAAVAEETAPPDPEPIPQQQAASSTAQSQRGGKGANFHERRGGRGGRGRGERRVDDVSNPDVEKAEKAEKAEGEVEDEPKTETARVQAVRGDRSGTGAVKKPKLTEAELAERMAAIALNNAKLSAAHAAAEADEAQFLARESEAAQQQRRERTQRREMDLDREKNRLRKMKAMERREWDSEKKEEDYSTEYGSGGRGRGYARRGAFGGVVRSGGSGDNQPELFDDGRDFGGRGRGRGGRGRGRGRGRGGYRGGDDYFSQQKGEVQQQKPKAQTAPVISAEEDFPSLPGSKPANLKTTVAVNNVAKRANEGETNGANPSVKPSPKIDVPSPNVERGTWADQMETPV
ncbi:MAG: hypothetical protein M1834_001751 [Cirrosporium novae-zelandiae]|nr:MAG: hypothetical protein M1834_001751 [Cirrosporium novae-zelandiae]